MTVQNLEEKAQLNEMIERLKTQFAAVSNNLEVQTADNAQLSRYCHVMCFCVDVVISRNHSVLWHLFRILWARGLITKTSYDFDF